MSLISLKLADFRVLMESRYDFLQKQCADYLADFPPSEAEITVSVTKAELEKELNQSREAEINASAAYAESVCLYRNLCLQLPMRSAMLMHAAVISDGEHAFAFTAPSGTGKSTHISRWRRAFGDTISVINGDKPILRLIDGVWWAYGTPWCGKEGWNTNTAKPLTALCFLSRGEENRINRIPPQHAVPALMHQIILPQNPMDAKAQMALLDHLVTHVPLYSLACNVSEDAARVARAAMKPVR